MAPKQGIYKSYLLTVLMVILAFNYVDRLALGLVLQNIKVDLQLSDTQLGVLSGIAFALFYSVMGIPIARWADRGNRVTIISLTIALWSAAVALCGTAGSFVQLMLIRVGVAVGEAGCIPPAHSLIADYFNRAERPRAVAWYMLGSPISVIIGFFLAGWLNEFYGWRVMFILLGLPGLALALLAWLTLKEPRRMSPSMRTAGFSQPARPAAPAAQPTLQDVFVTLWGNATFRSLFVCYSVVHLFAYGILQWQPTFFIRSYAMNTGELGGWFALIYGLGGIAGTYLGGMLASRYAANNERLQLKAIAMVYAVFGVLSFFIYLSTNKHVAFALLALSSVGGYLANGPLFATIQTLVPGRMRAMSIALLYLFANLVGLGLGPLMVGALSDVLRPWVGEESLRWAMLALCPGYFLGTWYALQGSRTVTQDLQAIPKDENDDPRDGHVAPVGEAARTC